MPASSLSSSALGRTKPRLVVESVPSSPNGSHTVKLHESLFSTVPRSGETLDAAGKFPLHQIVINRMELELEWLGGGDTDIQTLRGCRAWMTSVS